jgi:oligopeptide/dipeptide ABC transporter ATP-binding protein
VQAQILNLLTDLQRDLGLTYLFISHDLNVVQHMSDRVVVMYLGKIAEIGNSNDLFDEPKHPYTEALIAANPTTANLTRSRIRLRGTVPSPARPPQGCGFHTRCPRAFGDCGWEARDVLDLLRRDDRFAEADIELEATSPFQGTLTFATDSLAGLAAAHLAEEETSPAWLRDALVGLEIDAAKMTVTLKDAGPVELLALGPSRSTSCLLYASEPQ